MGAGVALVYRRAESPGLSAHCVKAFSRNAQVVEPDSHSDGTRRLVEGRLTFTPQVDGCYTFAEMGTVQPLLAGLLQRGMTRAGIEPAAL